MKTKSTTDDSELGSAAITSWWMTHTAWIRPGRMRSEPAPWIGGTAGSMSTRLNDFATGHKVVIQQRLHEADPAIC